MRIRLGVGPGDGNLADVGVEPERVPDGLGRVDDVVLAAVVGVALVHDRCLHGAPGLRARDADRLEAPLPSRVPPRGQRRDQVLVAVVVPVALRRASAVAAPLEAVHRHHRGRTTLGRHLRVPRRRLQKQDGDGGHERKLCDRHICCCVPRLLVGLLLLGLASRALVASAMSIEWFK